MSIEAMKLALEALETCNWVDDGGCGHAEYDHVSTNTAITSLRQAIEQAQEKTSWTLEDVKKSWKSGYEAGIEQAQKQEHIQKLEELGWSSEAINKANTPQHKQEPVADLYVKDINGDFHPYKEKGHMVSSRCALTSLVGVGESDYTTQKKEPVAKSAADHVKGEVGYCKFLSDVPNDTPLYTAPPPQRQWVGLTDEEKFELDQKYGDDTLAHFDAIEAKLKEKNT